jgi:hypothetical protein
VERTGFELVVFALIDYLVSVARAVLRRAAPVMALRSCLDTDPESDRARRSWKTSSLQGTSSAVDLPSSELPRCLVVAYL